MEPISGVGAAVAEVTTAAAGTAAVTAAEGVAAGAVQAAGEGAANIVTNATEQAIETTAIGVAESATDNAANLAAQGLAESAQDTLTSVGPDAALGEIKGGPQVIVESQGNDATTTTVSPAVEPAVDQSHLTDSGMDQRAIDAANKRIEESKAQGKDPDFFERKAIYDEEAAKLSTSPGAEDQTLTAQEAVVAEEAKTEGVTPAEKAPAGETLVQADSGITDEIRNDAHFKEIREQEKAVAQEKGEQVDDKELDQKALAKFNQEKDKQAEQSQLTPEQQQIQQLEEKIQTLIEQNEKLGKAMEELAEWAKGHEQDPKKKESLIALLAKIAGIIVLSSVVQTGQEVNPMKK